MKNLIIILALAGMIFLIASQLRSRHAELRQANAQPITPVYQSNALPLCIAAFQDVSGSIRKNGITLMRHDDFNPYYAATYRDIEINFGVISGMSAKQMLHLELPAAKYIKPRHPTFENKYSSKNKPRIDAYEDSLKRYEHDSTTYYGERAKRIAAFNVQFDSLTAPYRKKLSSSTDLVTAVSIAEHLFSYSSLNGAENHLILYSDGVDSRGRTVASIHANTTVILVNAGANIKTSIDKIVTNRFVSPQQAIAFTLRSKLTKKS